VTEEAARPGRSLGRIEGAVLRLFTKSATVGAAEMLGEQFVLLTLKGDSLRQVAWAPGQKVQLPLGGWVQRTLTPLAWDSLGGSMQLLIYLHGDAPLARWGRSLKEHQTCTIFGPRGSLELGTLQRPALLFGDETSLGLAHALRFTPNGARAVDIVLEVTSKQAVAPVLERMGLSHAHVVERRSDDSHLSDVEEISARLLQANSVEGVVLSGKASSIQRLNKRLRSLGLSGPRVHKRAYWATGKVGLD